MKYKLTESKNILSTHLDNKIILKNHFEGLKTKNKMSLQDINDQGSPQLTILYICKL